MEARSIPLSALNHWAYCARRCALIHVEQGFVENVHTARGRLEHEQADSGADESLHGTRVLRALPLWSERLGLTGKADVVELHADGRVYPVEYKHGRRRRWLNDDLQLCAQALCLEEMLGRPVERGAIYHRASRRRREVVFHAGLRAETERAVAAVRELLAQARAPPPVLDRRCRECSMRPVCLPEIGGAAAPAWLFDPDAVEAEDRS